MTEQPTYAERLADPVMLADLLASGATVFYEYSADDGALLRAASQTIRKLLQSTPSLPPLDHLHGEPLPIDGQNSPTPERPAHD